MRTGTLIDYRLRLHGLPIRWRSEIKAWEPPTRFIDEQTSGPYKRWRHEHTLEALAGGTNYIDDVYYELHGGPLAGFLNRLIVERDVAAIFAYRRDMLDHLFGGDAPNAARRSEKRPPSEGVVRFAGGPCETRSPHSDGIGREGYQRCPSDV